MVEGGGSKTFSKAKRFLYLQPALAHQLLDKITETIIVYLKRKIEAGVDAVQVFDSWAGVLSPALFEAFSLPYLTRICNAVTEAPIILFPKDGWFSMPAIGKINCTGVGLDWTVSPSIARHWLGDRKILQGNLDPCMLFASPQLIENATLSMIKAFGRRHIVNLGHGVYPDTPLDGVRCFVDTVKSFHY
jgi:uroporphyrinogen decarboxylase